MRATKGYVAGVGTTSALVGAIGCAFAVMSAVVAVHGWPLTLAPSGVTTVEGRSADGADVSPYLLDVFGGGGAWASRRGQGGRRAAARLRAVGTPIAAAPVASAFGPRADVVVRGGRQTPATRPGASAASPPPSGGGGSVPVQPGDGAAAGGSGGSTGSTGSGSGGTTALGGTVTQVASGAGTAVVQTGQQLSGGVQGTTGQLGGAVSQASPAVGQAVTQTGQLAGGVVSGATGTAGQLVSGAGAAVGGALGGLSGGVRTG
jgi:hypothetical protein